MYYPVLHFNYILIKKICVSYRPILRLETRNLPPSCVDGCSKALEHLRSIINPSSAC